MSTNDPTFWSHSRSNQQRFEQVSQERQQSVIPKINSLVHHEPTTTTDKAIIARNCDREREKFWEKTENKFANIYHSNYWNKIILQLPSPDSPQFQPKQKQRNGKNQNETSIKTESKSVENQRKRRRNDFEQHSIGYPSKSKKRIKIRNNRKLKESKKPQVIFI